MADSPFLNSNVQTPNAQGQAIQSNGFVRDIARKIENNLCVVNFCGYKNEDEDVSRTNTTFKINRLFDTLWKKVTTITICFGVLAAIIIFPVLHSTGHLGDRIQSSDSGQTATHYINATTIQTGTGDQWGYLGCYEDSTWNDTGPGPEGRTLDGISFEWKGNMTNELCADACVNYQNFGTEFYYQCFCGNKIDSQAQISRDGSCNTPCDGDPDEICGGAWNMSIYRNMGPKILSTSTSLTQFPP